MLFGRQKGENNMQCNDNFIPPSPSSIPLISTAWRLRYIGRGFAEADFGRRVGRIGWKRRHRNCFRLIGRSKASIGDT
jgi:hypothetical protein